MDQQPGYNAHVVIERRAHFDSDASIIVGRETSKTERVLLGANFDNRGPVIDNRSTHWVMAALRGNSFGCRTRRIDSNILPDQLGSLLRRHFCLRNSLRYPAYQRVLPYCRHHVEHSSANHARERAMDGGPAPLHRSVDRNRCSVTGHNCVEGSAGVIVNLVGRCVPVSCIFFSR